MAIWRGIGEVFGWLGRVVEKGAPIRR